MMDENTISQLKELRSDVDNAYQDASIFVVLLDLADSSDIEEVFMILHNVATELNKREELEKLYIKSREWTW